MEKSSHRIPILWLSVVILLLAARFVATFTAPETLWGLDSLAGRGPLWALLLLPFALPLVTKPTAAIGSLCARLAAGSNALFLSLAGALGAIFVLFRSRNFLLGDSLVYVHALGEGLNIEPATRREAGATFIVSALHWALRKTAIANSETTFVVASVAAGVVYVVLAFAVARLLARSAEGRALIFVSLLAGGFLQIFFGHAEYYSLVAASGMAFIYIALRSIKGKGSIIAAAFALALALVIHIMNAILLPSFLWLIVRAAREKRYASAAIAAVLAPALLLAVATLIRYPSESFLAIFLRGRHMLPLGSYDHYNYAYGMLQLAHIREIANELLLTAPCLPLLAVAALPALRGKGAGRDRGDERGRTDERTAGGDGESASREAGGFILLLAVGAALFSFTANPALGMARDWDIFAFPFMLVTLLAAVAAARSALRKPHLLWLCGAVALTGGLHLALFVDNNRTPSAYAPRFRRIAMQRELFTTIPRGELWRYLGWEAIKAGDLKQAADDLHRSIEDNPVQLKAYKMLAVLSIGGRYDWLASPQGADRRRALELDSEEKMTAEAARLGLESYYNKTAESAPSKVHALLGAGLAGLEVGAPDSLTIDAFRRAVEAEPENLDARALWGDVQRLHGNLDRAEAHYEAVLRKRKWHVRATIGRACVLGARGEPQMAYILVKELREHYPWSIEAQLFLKARNEGELVSPDDFKKFMIGQ